MFTIKNIFNTLFTLYLFALKLEVDFIVQYSIYFLVGFFGFLLYDLFVKILELQYTVIIKENVVKINTQNFNWNNLFNITIIIVLFWFFGEEFLEEFLIINAPFANNLYFVILLILSIFPFYKQVVINDEGINPSHLFNTKFEFDEIIAFKIDIETFEFETISDIYSIQFNIINPDEVKQINQILQKYIEVDMKLNKLAN